MRKLQVLVLSQSEQCCRSVLYECFARPLARKLLQSWSCVPVCHENRKYWQGPQPRLVPFSISEEQAASRVAEWVRKQLFGSSMFKNALVLGAWGGGLGLEKHLLPFWVFEATVNSTYEVRVGHWVMRTRFDPVSKSYRLVREMAWRSAGSLSHRSLYSNTDSNLHFSASLSYRPALTHVLKVDPSESLPFSPSRSYDATVHRCMINSKETWEREAQPILRRLEHARAEEESKSRYDAAEIEISGLRMEVDSVRCFLLYAPAYVLTYQQMNADSYVVVNGSTAQVAGDVHYSRQRVAALFGVAGALLASLLGWPVMFCGLVAAAAGVAAAAYAPVARTIHFNTSRDRMFAKLDAQRGPQFEYFGWEYTRPSADDFAGYSSHRTREQQQQGGGEERRGQREWSWSWDWGSGSARGRTSHDQQRTDARGEQRQRSRESSWGGGGTSTARPQAPDYYVVLGVARTATTQQIKDAYRREALKWHPDMQTDAVKKKAAEERFKVLNDAYRTLRDENARRQYDRVRA